MSMDATEQWALDQDALDPLAGFRDEFFIPVDADGRDWAYFCGNSLGLQPRAARAAIHDELRYWETLAVEGHFRGKLPWMDYHEFVRDGLALLAGAKPSEVVAMNSLTANLHFLMAGFYRPTRDRHAILIEAGAFPSDRYAVESQIRFHGFDPADALIELEGDEPGGTLSDGAIAQAIARHGERLALVLMPGVQYRNGQVFDLRAIAAQARAVGAIAGFDLAHAFGNVPVDLHDIGADFAVWCHYKYGNSGPGAVGGAFVHERHANTDRPRFAGWWGHDKTTRFQMGPAFVPTPGADGWQMSNPPILALAPLRVSMDIFQRAGLDALRRKSIALTGWLAERVESDLGDVLDIVTPREVHRRGAQLSLRVRAGRDAGRALFETLNAQGTVGDWREPDVIRISPAPLYNRYSDVLRLLDAVGAWRDAGGAST
jgi:kynureninase